MKMPRVSIGLPVYNGENYLGEALDSILAQSFEDFELIISDNASTDATAQICREYAAKDRRIRYYRNNTNVGAAKNFNRVFELSSGEYFKWASHDDVLAPDFILKCTQVLDRDPSVILCHSRTKIIGEHGEFLYNYNIELNFDSPRALFRFYDVVLLDHTCFPIFGIIRSEILRKTPLIDCYAASDRVLLGALSLYGRFFEIPEYLFFNRNHPQRSSRVYDHRAVTVWFDPLKSGKIVFLFWKILLAYLVLIRRAPLSWYERIRCYGVVQKWMFKRWKNLAYDFVEAARQLKLAKLRYGLLKP